MLDSVHPEYRRIGLTGYSKSFTNHETCHALFDMYITGPGYICELRPVSIASKRVLTKFYYTAMDYQCVPTF